MFITIFYFFTFHNIFLDTQLALVFHIQKGSLIDHDHIIAFCLFLLQKDIDIFHKHIGQIT